MPPKKDSAKKSRRKLTSAQRKSAARKGAITRCKNACESSGGKKKVSSAKRKAGASAAKQNPWIKHVKKYAKDNDMTYAMALKDPDCSGSYRK